MEYQTPITDFTIRTAQPDDCELILEFVRELAEYEKLLDQVVADEMQLRHALFSDRPTAEVLIGEYQRMPVGFALFFHNFSTFLGRSGIYLEDLFVRQAHRGNGFGKALLACLASIAVERNCGRLEWSVLDWNQPAISFYDSIGAQQMNSWIVNRLTDESLEQLAQQFRYHPTSDEN